VHTALYRWDVPAAAYLIGGGCSDDGFIDFRAGLTAQGRDWYEKLAASPDSLADHPAMVGGGIGAETGEDFDFDDAEQVHRRLPRLVAPAWPAAPEPEASRDSGGTAE